jgi:hypothetical protein
MISTLAWGSKITDLINVYELPKVQQLASIKQNITNIPRDGLENKKISLEYTKE